MDRPDPITSWAAIRGTFRDRAMLRKWTIEANDGIIATAGLLLGFAGAGASNRVLLFTATAALIVGGLSVGGAEWAEEAAEREAQLALAEEEQREISTDPEAELEELTSYWEKKGLAPDLARRVAEQLTAFDALGAQLEAEHGFDEVMPRAMPIWVGLSAALASVVGALIPLLITYFAPVDIESWIILAAAVVALAITSLVSARTGRLSPRKMLGRTLVVGLITLLVSYVAGELLL